MGLIFDIHAAKFYESWCHSHQGRAMEKFTEKAIISLLNPQAKERVLDIGCGEGNHLLLFSKLGLDIHGIDASPFMITRARNRLGHRCSLKIGAAEDLPYDDNEFDLAVFIHTLEFLDDPLQALREAGRVARKKVFIGVMNNLSCYNLKNKFQSLYQQSLLSHVRFYNLWDLKSYVQTAYGTIPVAWSCAQMWPSFLGRLGSRLSERFHLNHFPVGAFIGLAATIIYHVRTDNLPLKVRVKKARHSMVEGLTMGHSRHSEGVQIDERSPAL
jgi:ubiquinone/menaquinone biosynthesis C-methylase UbiE